jgi:L-fuconolactonase
VSLATGARDGAAGARIDAHMHLWRVGRGDYPWMPADGPLRRDFTPAQADRVLDEAGVASVILVQAAPTADETEYLLGIADGWPRVRGVVGWVDLESPGPSRLDAFVHHPALVGIRPMIQDLRDPTWVLRPQVREGLRAVERAGLTFDLLTRPAQMQSCIEALASMPDLPFVVDHLAKPDFSTVDPGWKAAMTSFAEMPLAHCKLAGLVSEVGPEWRTASYRAHVDHVLEAFGPDRVMFGSDWPVHVALADYGEVWSLAESLLSGVSSLERDQILGGTAERFYRRRGGFDHERS